MNDLPLLELRGVRKEYPGTLALDSVDLDVRRGELVALVGENGAGKSTLSGIIAGSQPPTGGTMNWEGRDYRPTSPGDAIAQGIGMIQQEMRLLPDLTAAENVMVGRLPRRPGGFVDHPKLIAAARSSLDQLGFAFPAETVVRELSVAAQQQVEIAKALALDARLLILDEPTAALGQRETEALFECIARLKEDGVSFIYISHRLHEIEQIADRIAVLRDGRLVALHEEGKVPADRIVREMVGRSVDRLFPERGDVSAEVVLEVSELSGNRFEDVSFELHAGEVFGIAGIVGAGRTELVRAIAGVDPVRNGSVTVRGRRVRPGSVREALGHGVVMVPEDRKHQGVVVPMTIQENIGMANLSKVSTGGWMSERRVSRLASEVIARMGIKGRPEAPLSSLSGGNQQKVVIGKWMAKDPTVVILDEPTRGIDVGARAAIYEVIAEMAAAGMAVIVVSSDLDEVLGLSHRVMVLAAGRAQGTLDHHDADPERVMALAAQ